MSNLPSTDDPYFQVKDPRRPIISDKAFLALMSTLKFIAVCALIGLICWLQPDVIGWACGVIVVVALIYFNPF